MGRCVQKAGGQVIIAESPGGPYTPAAMKAVFRGCGYTEMAKECGFTLYTDCKSREVSLPGAVRCRQLSVAEPFLTRDYLIDLAKLKTHGMVGFFRGGEEFVRDGAGAAKAELHCRFPEKQAFSEMLVDLCDFLKPDLCFTDGILAMEATAPTGGQPRRMGVLGASKSPYAPRCVHGLPDRPGAGGRPDAEGGLPAGAGAHFPGGVLAGEGADRAFGSAGFCKGPGLQHGLY